MKKKAEDVFTVKNLVTWNFLLWSLYYLLKKCDVALGRFFYSLKDVYRSFVYWMKFVYQGAQDRPSESTVTVNDIPNVDIQKFIPFDIAELVRRFETLPRRFFDVDNFNDFNVFFMQSFYWLTLFVLIAVMIWLVVFYVCGDMILDETGKPVGYLSPSYHKILAGYYKRVKPVLLAVRDYFIFLTKKWPYIAIFAVIWGLCFNIFTIFFEFFAYV